MKDDRLYLIHVLERVLRIEAYTRGGREAFLASPMAQDAVIRNFEVIGEAVKRMSEEVRQRYAHVPWRRIAGFRDVLIHGYEEVDVEEVWGVIERDVPGLRRDIEEALRSFGIDPDAVPPPVRD